MDSCKGLRRCLPWQDLAECFVWRLPGQLQYWASAAPSLTKGLHHATYRAETCGARVFLKLTGNCACVIKLTRLQAPT